MENQHRQIKGYRELSQEEINLMNMVKRQGEALELLIARIETEAVDKRWISIGKTHLQQGLMALTRAIAQPTFFSFLLVLLLAGCVSPYKESDGHYVKLAAPETRSFFGTNMAFSRLQRCEGPEKGVMFYTEGDFSNCQYLTAEEQEAWKHGYSRGAGPEIVGAVIMGGSIGAGAALSGGANASAGAAASATNIAVQTVTPHKKH